MNFRGPDHECDQNGNFCGPNSQKDSVLQIISETLRSTSPGTDTVNAPLKPEINFGNLSGFGGHNDPESYLFNPGDKLSSPTPPLAPTRNPDVVLSTSIRESAGSPPTKDCHLGTVLGSARRCLKQLKIVKDGLASLVAKDEHMSQGKKISHPTADYELVALLGEYTMHLTRQAFTPAHRLYTSALGLHMAEDLIRNPRDPTLLNFKMGPIVRPDWNTIIHTQMKLRACVDAATEMYNRFGRDASSSIGQVEQMQYIMVTLMHAFQDLYATALGSTDIFKILLHIEDYGEQILQEFLLSMESMERSDLLLQVQALRRSIDDIVIVIEQLSWAAYVVYRLASGKSLTPSPDGSISRITQGDNALFKINEKRDPEALNRKPYSSSKTCVNINNKPREMNLTFESRRPSKEQDYHDRNLAAHRSSPMSKANPESHRSSKRPTPSGKSQERKLGAATKSFIPTPTGSPLTRSRRHSRTLVNDQDARREYARNPSRNSSRGSLSTSGGRKPGYDTKGYSSIEHKSKGSAGSKSSSRESGVSIHKSAESSKLRPDEKGSHHHHHHRHHHKHRSKERDSSSGSSRRPKSHESTHENRSSSSSRRREY